jgi:hypothetical protein
MLGANHSFYAEFYRPQKNPLKVEPENNFEFFTKDAYAYYLKMGTLANLDSPAGGYESAVSRPDDSRHV